MFVPGWLLGSPFRRNRPMPLPVAVTDRSPCCVPETERLLLRSWREADLDPFGALNADPRVMEYFPSPLTREMSDALAGRAQARLDELGYGLFDKETRSYRGLSLHDFRRSACRNMIKRGVPQVVAMSVSGHKTDSKFRRYAITDKTSIQEAFAQAR